MGIHSTTDFDRVGRIIRLLKIYRQAQTPMALWLTREQYLKYYLSASDWAFWQALKAEELSHSSLSVCA